MGRHPVWSRGPKGNRFRSARSGALTPRFRHAWRLGDHGVRRKRFKSASLMRLVLTLSSDGHAVGWVDRDSELTSRQIYQAVETQRLRVLGIDDADTFGTELSSIIRELALIDARPLIVVALRATKVDRYVNPAMLGATPLQEVGMPPLNDGDIDAILDSLDREHRLGRLAGMRRREQRAVFRELAGRQLLVAMIQATSGEALEEKAVRELNELDPPTRVVYALVAVASALRYSLAQDEVLIASGDRSNTALNQLDALLRRGVVVSAEGGRKVRARHRVIADLILEELRRTGQLVEVVAGLALVAATKVGRELHRSARPWRFLRQIINHDFLIQTLGVDQARVLYESIQDILHWDYHYWLQRGSLEVEVGNLRLAENFLSQARGLSSGDPLVETEWAYLLFKKASADPLATGAGAFAADARTTLLELIRVRGQTDSYPYHVLGSQGLSWSRRGVFGSDARGRYLRDLIAIVEEGLKRHPSSDDLTLLLSDVRREYLELATA